MISISWASKVKREVKEFMKSEKKKYETIERMRVKINIEWSWNRIN